MARLSDLPSEIYAVILSHVPPSDRQKAVLNLIRALPRSPIPRNQIFDHIIVHSQAAALYLYHLFRKRKTDEGAQYNPSEQVVSIAVRVWSIDADIIVNLLVLLPSVPVMQLFIGTTYSPEHLYDLFTKPRLKLRDLRLRFKPYVEKATYLPFLQGAYFDQTLVQIAKWPVTEESRLENMSITQDTISYKAHVKFAQPIASPIRSYAEVQTNQYFQVFFSFKPLTDLSLSPVGQHLRALRISVPAKPVTPHLASHDTSFPKLDFLDISTTALPPPSAEKAIVSLLERLIRLRHVVVDRNAGTMPRDSPGWTSLGRACALAGVGKAKRKEKDIQEWTDARRREEEAVQAALNGEAPVAPAPAPAPPAARVRRGRRGLATATISLRERQSQARTTNDAPVGSSSTTSNRDDATARRVRVIPSPPTLRTFSTAFAGPSNPTTQQRADWGKAFEDGFMDGCRTLNAIWKRMQDSATVRVMRFTDADPNPNAFKHDDDEGPAIFRDVADIAIAGHWIGWEPTRPIICFGTERAVAKPAVDALSGSLGQMGIGTPGAFDGERAAYPAGTAMSADQGTMTSKAPARGTSVSDTGPSSVGGLWEVEEFIEWGPGHTDGCGHNIGRQIFE